MWVWPRLPCPFETLLHKWKECIFILMCPIGFHGQCVAVCNLKHVAQFSSCLTHTGWHQTKMMQGLFVLFYCIFLKCAYFQHWWMNSCPSLLWMLGACIGVLDHVSCYGVKSFLSWQQYRISIFRHCSYLNLIPSDSNRKGYIWTF